jgi:hypothetical protein
MPVAAEPVVVTISHRLGRDAAKQRIDSGIDSIRRDLLHYVSTVEYSWDEYRLNFHAAAMMQKVTGAIEVFDDSVRISLELPWFLHLVARSVADRIQHRAASLLEGPKGAG